LELKRFVVRPRAKAKARAGPRHKAQAKAIWDLPIGRRPNGFPQVFNRTEKLAGYNKFVARGNTGGFGAPKRGYHSHEREPGSQVFFP